MSNSVLLMGPRGGGKTALVETVISRLQDNLSAEHQKSNGAEVSSDNNGGLFYIVRLNGLIHTDDKQAFRDIARQLLYHQKNAIELSAAARRLLENGSVSDDGDENDGDSHKTVIQNFTSYADALSWLLGTLSDHNKQLLLYTLFDIAQSKANAIAVIGLTCRLDAVSMLEKRVRSRFSHRVILLHPIDTFERYLDLATTSLCMNVTKMTKALESNVEKDIEEAVQQYTIGLQHLVKLPNFVELVRGVYDLFKDVRSLYRLLISPVMKLSKEQPKLEWSMFENSIERTKIDGKMILVQGLSLLEISLVLSCKSLLRKYISQYNFEMVYDEYKEFMERVGRQAGIERYKKPVALKAFDQLLAIELLKPVDSITKCPKEYRMTQLMMTSEQVRSAIHTTVVESLPTVLRQWAAEG